MKLTRRQLGAAALASVAARAQTPPQPAPENLTPQAQLQGKDAELQAAKDQVKAASESLSRYEVPMATEPAFEFQA
jgi:hypothetical protein